MNGTRLMPYPVGSAIADAAYRGELTPTGVFAVLLPVWRVEVRASVVEAVDPRLIDRYLARAVAGAGPRTAGELAAFFSLDPVVVDRALRFLTAVGHLAVDGGRHTLTELGRRSVRDGRSYRVLPHDRRTLYFDAYGSRPLPTAYHRSRTVRFLTPAEVSASTDRDGSTCQPLGNITVFRPAALTALATAPDRTAFNLPERVDELAGLGEELVYLPLYVVRGVLAGGRPGYRVYGQAGDVADPYLTRLCEQTPELVAACENEARANLGTGRERITEWLRGRGLGEHGPVLTTGDLWRVTLPPEAFGTAVPLDRLGAHLVLRTLLCHVWCADERTRRHALVERLGADPLAGPVVDADLVRRRLGRLSAQLGLDADLTTVRRWAAEFGRTTLADQLGSLGA